MKNAYGLLQKTSVSTWNKLLELLSICMGYLFD